MSRFPNKTFVKYGIPIISYRDAVWPDKLHPPDEIGVYWNGLSHPWEFSHLLFAKMVAFSLLEMRERMSQETFHNFSHCIGNSGGSSISGSSIGNIMINPEHHNDIFCESEATSFYADRGERNFSPLTNDGWRFFEDRPLKPGWIADFCSENISRHATISFPVIVGENGTVVITFLQVSSSVCV